MDLTPTKLAICLLHLVLSLMWNGHLSLASIASPFFFLCQYHRDLNQPGAVQGEIALSVNVKGNPEFYEPGKIYEVSVTSSLDFDGFLMMGLYTTLSGTKAKTVNLQNGNLPSQGGGEGRGLMCAVVHSQLSNRPSKSLTFSWMAPAAGTGCVNFLATATLGQEIMFEDTLTLQLCEAGDGKKDMGLLDVSGLHDHGVVLREDFELGEASNVQLWSEMISGEITDQCGNVLYGKAAVFCKPSGTRSVTTVPLNTTAASTLQFALGVGNCSSSRDDPPISVFYGTEKCTKWHELEQIRLQPAAETTVHILCLPVSAKSSDVCIQWSQELSPGSSKFKGCWALDNVIVSNVAERPTFVEDAFDPLELGNWLFFPGGAVKHKCHSEGNALVFHGGNNHPRYVTTRDLNLFASVIQKDIIFDELFEKPLHKGWVVKGGELSTRCEVSNSKSLMMSGKGSRKFCTPFLNSSNAGNLRFHFLFGGENCSKAQSNNSVGHTAPVFVYAEPSSGEQIILTDVIHAAVMEATLVSLSIPINAQTPHTRFCWSQSNNSGKDKDIWVVDNIMLLPWIPSEITRVLQFSVNLQCGHNVQENNIQVEFSTSSGHNWHSLHDLCLPPSCSGFHSALKSRVASSGTKNWMNIAYPLPYASLVDGVRFWFKQIGKYASSNWAIDNVFIGYCPDACHGHGKCTSSGCLCDMGYSGVKCEISAIKNPLYLAEMFTSSNLQEYSTLSKILGAELGYQCGTLGSGKAVVFDNDGSRLLITRAVNSTTMRFLQFTARLGSASRNSPCMSPDHSSEAVYIHYSCNGGIVWNMLTMLEQKKFLQPKIVSLLLPTEAQGASCLFKIWQPFHSGKSLDVWAVDDLSLSPSLLNAISLNFSDSKAMNASVRYTSGKVKKFCNSKEECVSFDEETYGSNTRLLETKSLTVGPSYMVQFDLIMGCKSIYSLDRNNKVHLEFSTNHGMSWLPVYKPCLPSNGSCNGVFTKGTVYDSTEFGKWKRVTISLLPATWSSSTRFRFIQKQFEASDTWAIDSLYIGPQCKDMCSGHGQCVDGACLCDDGFFGESCVPKNKLKNTVVKKFETPDDLEKENFEVSGGSIVSPEEGCGSVASGGAVYFHQDGIRQLVTNDLNTENMDFIQFFIRIGGGDSSRCNNASQKNEGVLVQYSNDAGISWGMLRGLEPENYRMPRLEHLTMPYKAKTYSTRLRWWQPQHSGDGKDQWAIDDLYLDVDSKIGTADQVQKASASDEHQLISVTSKSSMQRYCNSSEKVLLLNGHEKWKFIVTKPLQLSENEVIMFQINVGCGDKFDWDSAVRLEYSHDAGVTWNVVEELCYSSSECRGSIHEASVYYSGYHGKWRKVLITVSHHLAQKQVLLRFSQGQLARGVTGQPTPFAVKDFYVGPPCPLNCLGHGVCSDHACLCDSGYKGPVCSSVQDNPAGVVDRFDDTDAISGDWDVSGGLLSNGCGNLSLGNSLYFGMQGHRIAETIDLDTTHMRTLNFIMQLGRVNNKATCKRPMSRHENVFVQYSNDHGLIWETLRELHYEVFSLKPSTVEISLPEKAKTTSTSFRWWQPLAKRGFNSAQWAIDNVQVLGNLRNMKEFFDSFNPMSIENWFLTQHGTPRSGCGATGRALIFAADHNEEHYAETWDFEISLATFLQYDINLGCTFHTQPYSVQLEFSLDKGRSWALVNPPCVPPDVGCQGYSAGSIHFSSQHANWTRVTTYLPIKAVSPSTRFRWIENVQSTGHSWAIDNVYLGEGCTWMCSGHGHCSGNNKCVCDPGFGGMHCVPIEHLPCELRDSFDNSNYNTSLWLALYGGEISTRCGTLISGSALTFYKGEARIAMTQDLDLTSAQYIQFTLKYGCRSSVAAAVTRANGILIQYSNNGGISWNLLKELHFTTETPPQYYLISIKDPEAQTNATRIRFWQPHNDGMGTFEWAVDDFYVGGMMLNPNVLYDPIQLVPQPDAWMFWPGGNIGNFCDESGREAMVFSSSEGERSFYTRDMTVFEDYVIQFEIKVGCGTTVSPEDPVSLEYSTNKGITWQLAKESWAPHKQGPEAMLQAETPSIYYSNSHPKWQRVIVPLQGLKICGNVRFRWTQGTHSIRDLPSSWAMDNVYIGPSCPSHCMSKGSCLNGVMCVCDEGFEGSFCHSIVPNPSLLKDEFDEINANNWVIRSGTEISLSCGILISGTSLVFSYQGERMLISRDLDLTLVGAIQFYLRLGCQMAQSISEEHPVLLQYSVDGGATWNLLEEFSFGENPRNPHSSYIAIELPHHARTNATKIQWWQPSLNGTFYEEWALDQVFIGGDMNGITALNDDFSINKEANWILNPGAVLEPTCGSRNNFLHFKGQDDVRYAVTTDVVVNENTYVQFELVMGCNSTGDSCYDVILEFSTDMGKTWSLVRDDCLPILMDCSEYHEGSVYHSDMHQQVSRITLPLPHKTRTQTTRFRWIQPLGFKTSQTWAIGHLYIGEECKSMCSGHGKCSAGSCRCDDGWTGDECEESKSPLPTELRDTFDDRPSVTKYHLVAGGVISKLCGPVASGTALHMYGACSRHLVTRDLNLQNATVINFYFRYGCMSPPSSGNHTVFLQYSLSGGILWKSLKELDFKKYRTSGFLSVPLPEAARQQTVRIRWWQPQHDGRAHSDWALDDVFIGGRLHAPDHFSDLQTGHFLNLRQWLSVTNVEPAQLCNSAQPVAVGRSTTKEDSVLVTADIHVKKHYVLEFMIAVGCNASWMDPGIPVHLEYSVDFGQSWLLLLPQCLPSQLSCGGVAQYPSVYYSPLQWKRISIPLNGDVVSRWTRFRWSQAATMELSPSHEWGLRDVYVGHQCVHHCHGHGSCRHGHCTCDKGYTGDNCHETDQNLPFLKDSFDDPAFDSLLWSYATGGAVTSPCSALVEGNAAVFYGPVHRVLETVDLDLRDAKFVEYVSQIGGKGDNLACISADSRNQSVQLQFSRNGGMTWMLLHELDSSLYSHPRSDHILLPYLARTASTRLRWWQSFAKDPWPAFSVDNVYIGGNEINAFQLLESFDEEGGPSQTNWRFYPYGKIQDKFCENPSGKSLVWKEDADIEKQGAVTRELIVENNFMIQFKIVVGCSGGDASCVTNHSVRLEYCKEPGTDEWDLVREGCYPSNAMNSECSPNDFHSPSVYSANSHSSWSLVSMFLTEKTFSSATQFRWVQDIPLHLPKPRHLPAWSIDDVYIGEACPNLCRGKGNCINGQCHCVPGYSGVDCQPSKNARVSNPLPSNVLDSFEDALAFSSLWETVKGGGIGQECGSLAPHGGGNHLHMGQCGVREAVTKELDTSLASKLMFVLRIGSEEDFINCHVNLHHPRGADKSVLLQYTMDNGIAWKLIAFHSSGDFKKPRRLVYEIPEAAKMYGVRFRWMQPFHEGQGKDQWALDNVEIVR